MEAEAVNCRVLHPPVGCLLDQQNLITTNRREPDITVNDIEVAQFTYLLLNNQKTREVIDTITSKAVLILGRFSEERKAIRNERGKLTVSFSPIANFFGSREPNLLV
jgi:hypothetical protein